MQRIARPTGRAARAPVLRAAGAERPGLLDTLSAAYAEAGRFEDAVKTAARAAALAEAGNPALAAEIRHRIGLYEAGKRYRDKH